jgi:hypothetical protein
LPAPGAPRKISGPMVRVWVAGVLILTRLSVRECVRYAA